jgi:signal transduction histidine kinase
MVRHEGATVAALVHDKRLKEQPELLETVSAAAALALENQRLDAALRARVEELRTSRARIVEASYAARRRLERDLHDGAQQRLVALALDLRLARTKFDADPAAAAELLDASIAELAQATDELRELARGIHPAVLTDRGLGAALDALATRAPLPVELGSVPEERLPEPVETAAYFVVAEALTNVAKYAEATHAEVSVERANGTLRVEVRDDGVGGADPAAGTGLRGLADRIAALDGKLDVTSPSGSGTVVRAEVPCA